MLLFCSTTLIILMKRVLISIIVVVGLTFGMVGPVTAAETPSEDPTLHCEEGDVDVDLDAVVGLYHENTDMVPSAVESIVTSNETEVQVRGADQQNYTVQTDGLEVTSVELGSADDPDAIMITDRETACEVFFSDDPADHFYEAYNDGDIELETKGTFSSAAVFVVESIVDGYNYVDEALDDLF